MKMARKGKNTKQKKVVSIKVILAVFQKKSKVGYGGFSAKIGRERKNK